MSDVQEFAYANNMQLNPAKCKVMSVDFLHNNSYQLLTVASSDVVLEHVSSFKLLRVYMARDLTWAVHCDFMLKKANRGLYALRSLRRCGVTASDMILVYTSLVRSILQYAYVMFSNLPLYLLDAIEKMQKRALQIIFPKLSYNDTRRIIACKRFITSLKLDKPVYKLVSSRTVDTQYNCVLRPRELKKFKYPWHYDHQV